MTTRQLKRKLRHRFTGRQPWVSSWQSRLTGELLKRWRRTLHRRLRLELGRKEWRRAFPRLQNPHYRYCANSVTPLPPPEPRRTT